MHHERHRGAREVWWDPVIAPWGSLKGPQMLMVRACGDVLSETISSGSCRLARMLTGPSTRGAAGQSHARPETAREVLARPRLATIDTRRSRFWGGGRW